MREEITLRRKGSSGRARPQPRRPSTAASPDVRPRLTPARCAARVAACVTQTRPACAKPPQTVVAMAAVAVREIAWSEAAPARVGREPSVARGPHLSAPLGRLAAPHDAKTCPSGVKPCLVVATLMGTICAPKRPVPALGDRRPSHSSAARPPKAWVLN